MKKEDEFIAWLDELNQSPNVQNDSISYLTNDDIITVFNDIIDNKDVVFCSLFYKYAKSLFPNKQIDSFELFKCLKEKLNNNPSLIDLKKQVLNNVEIKNNIVRIFGCFQNPEDTAFTKPLFVKICEEIDEEPRNWRHVLEFCVNTLSLYNYNRMNDAFKSGQFAIYNNSARCISPIRIVNTNLWIEGNLSASDICRVLNDLIMFFHVKNKFECKYIKKKFLK